MAIYGKMGVFNPDNENGQQYIEILGWYFLVDKAIDKNKDKLIFLSVCGTSFLWKTFLCSQKLRDKRRLAK